MKAFEVFLEAMTGLVFVSICLAGVIAIFILPGMGVCWLLNQ